MTSHAAWHTAAHRSVIFLAPASTALLCESTGPAGCSSIERPAAGECSEHGRHVFLRRVEHLDAHRKHGRDDSLARELKLIGEVDGERDARRRRRRKRRRGRRRASGR
eukprot:6341615-Prymnesium_polylepis.1